MTLATHPCMHCYFILYELLGVILIIMKTLLEKAGLLVLWQGAPVFTLIHTRSKSKLASNRGNQQGFYH